MPAATEYPTDLNDVDELVDKEKRARQDYIAAAWKYYKGEHRRPLKVTHGQPDDNVIINVSKILIDRGISMLIGQGVEFNLDGQPNQRTPTEEYIDRAWNGGLTTVNKKLLKLNDMGMNGYISGQPAAKVIPVEGGWPRIVNLDPSIVFAFWQADDIESILWYTLYWSDTNRQDIVNFEDGMWAIFDLVKDGKDWKIENDDLWPYSWSPILTWKNLPNPNEFYGVSDLDHADLNDKINFIASNTNRILQKHAHPRTIVRGASLSDIVKDAIGGIIAIAKPPDQVSVDNLEMQSDLVSSMRYMEELRATFFALGASVDMTTWQDKIGQITNFGLRVLFKDALDRLILKRALYGEAIVEINRRILEIGGHGDNNETKITWPDPLPANLLEAIEAVERQTSLGVMSKETASDKLGLDYKQEQERLENEEETGVTVETDTGTTTEGDIPENLESAKGLNGAQITAALDILARVQAGVIETAAAFELLLALGIESERVSKIIASTKRLPRQELMEVDGEPNVQENN